MSAQRCSELRLTGSGGGCTWAQMDPPETQKDERLTDEFFSAASRGSAIRSRKRRTVVRVGMGGALMSIGKRNKKLNAAAIKTAKAIGPIHLKDGDEKCEPMNVLKHLTRDYVRNKLV